MATSDTIAAIATPQGSGGVGVIRISGSASLSVARTICSQFANHNACNPPEHSTPKPRLATLSDFVDEQNRVIDTGIVLFFPCPHSYTGEDVLELQGHGGAVVLDMLLQRVLSLGVRMARPGEFTERAYLNNKLDLSQAEAVSDLITSGSQAAARAALKSLQGEFSTHVHALTEELTGLRIYMEAALDFPEEEIDFLASDEMRERAVSLRKSFKELLATTKQGRLLRDGLTVVIAGKPNAGKSSLLNRLTGENSAIVTDIKGTTRDLLHERIQIDGLPVQLIDTAGLHASEDRVEQEGIKRAVAAIQKADRVLWMEDISQLSIDSKTTELPKELIEGISAYLTKLMKEMRATSDAIEVADDHVISVDVILNKTDLAASGLAEKFALQGTTRTTVEESRLPEAKGSLKFEQCIKLSAATGEGMEVLRSHLKQQAGYDAGNDDVFIARRRHIVALEQAAESVEQGFEQLENHYSPELAAEDFKRAQQALGEITGEVSSDDLLGRIFAGFCIGK